MKYQSFTELKFKNCKKRNSFHSIKIKLRDETDKKYPFVSVGITQVVLIFRKTLKNRFSFKFHQKWLLKIS